MEVDGLGLPANRLPAYVGQSRRATAATLLMILVALAILLWGTSCQSPSGGSGVVASFTLQESWDQTPTALVRYDLNTTVAWGSFSPILEVFLETSGFPIHGPMSFPAGHARVIVHDPAFEWTGPIGGPLPAQAKHLFREAEIALWGLSFSGEATP